MTFSTAAPEAGEGESYRDLPTRLSTALAMTEAAYLEASEGSLAAKEKSCHALG